MVDQLRRAPLASLPAPAFGTGATAVGSRRLAPHNVRPNGVTHLSSAGARVPTPSSVGRRGPLAMAFGAAGTAFLLAAVCREISDILGSSGDLQRYRLFKNWPEGPDKIGSTGERGFARARKRLQGPADRLFGLGRWQ